MVRKGSVMSSMTNPPMVTYEKSLLHLSLENCLKIENKTHKDVDLLLIQEIIYEFCQSLDFFLQFFKNFETPLE